MYRALTSRSSASESTSTTPRRRSGVGWTSDRTYRSTSYIRCCRWPSTGPTPICTGSPSAGVRSTVTVSCSCALTTWRIAISTVTRAFPHPKVRLDETLQAPGNVLHYVYDYGDSSKLTLRLEEILPAGSESPTAAVVDGRRAAPPEDCGGITDAESLAEVLDDPSRFEPDQINEALRGPFFILREYGVDRRLVDLVHRLHYTRAGRGLADRMIRLISGPTMLGEAELTTYLRAPMVPRPRKRRRHPLDIGGLSQAGRCRHRLENCSRNG